MSESCPAIEAQHTLWGFCPSIAAAYTILVLFGLCNICTFRSGNNLSQAFCWTLLRQECFQTLAYIFRVLSIQNPTSLGLYATWFVLILIAPIWINAFVYMVMGRMVWNFTEVGKIWGLSASRLGQVFVVLDIVAAIIQIYGAASAADQNSGNDVILQGLHIYMAGVAIQQCFICVFLFFAIRFHQQFLANSGSHERKRVLLLLYILYAAVTLITARIIFRLVEYSSGLQSTIPNHEVYQYCLDSLLMLLASSLFNIVHPGRVMPGKACDIPSRRERKRLNKA